MKAIINANVVLPDKVLEGSTIIFDEKIRIIDKTAELSDCEIIDAKGNYVIPGLIDLHMHGYRGFDASDSSLDAVTEISKAITENGVTAFCPTTMTMPKKDIKTALSNIAFAKDNAKGAKILGANVEGPYINPSRKGAQNENDIKAPDSDFILSQKDIIKLVTLAPEVSGSSEFIKRVKADSDVIISIGHTDADFDTAKNAIDLGASHVTHLFNTMPSMLHRAPGVIGAALSEESVSVELIADTIHVHPALFSIVRKLKKDTLCLITDCMRAGGMPDGEYTLGGQKVFVKGDECRLSDGTLAGSVLTLNKAVHNMIKFGGAEVFEAVKCASLNPAKVIGEADKIGSIDVGKSADLVICDKEFNVKETYINGKKV